MHCFDRKRKMEILGEDESTDGGKKLKTSQDNLDDSCAAEQSQSAGDAPDFNSPSGHFKTDRHSEDDESLCGDIVVKKEVVSDSEEQITSQPISSQDFIIERDESLIRPSDGVPHQLFNSEPTSDHNEQDTDLDTLDASSLAILNEFFSTNDTPNKQSLLNKEHPLTLPAEMPANIDSINLGKVKMECVDIQNESEPSRSHFNSDNISQEAAITISNPLQASLRNDGGSRFEIIPTGVYLSKQSAEYKAIMPGGLLHLPSANILAEGGGISESVLAKLRMAHGINQSGTYRPSQNTNINADILRQLKVAQEKEGKPSQGHMTSTGISIGAQAYKGSGYHPSEHTDVNSEILNTIKSVTNPPPIITVTKLPQGTTSPAQPTQCKKRKAPQPTKVLMTTPSGSPILQGPRKAPQPIKIPITDPPPASMPSVPSIPRKRSRAPQPTKVLMTTPSGSPILQGLRKAPQPIKIPITDLPQTTMTSAIKCKATNPAIKEIVLTRPDTESGTWSVQQVKPVTKISLVKKVGKPVSILKPQFKPNAPSQQDNKPTETDTKPVKQATPSKSVDGESTGPNSKDKSGRIVVASQYNTESDVKSVSLIKNSDVEITQTGSSQQEVPPVNSGKSSEHAQSELDLLAMNTIANLIGFSDDTANTDAI